eukprot:tig00001286_g8019.t1
MELAVAQNAAGLLRGSGCLHSGCSLSPVGRAITQVIAARLIASGCGATNVRRFSESTRRVQAHRDAAQRAVGGIPALRPAPSPLTAGLARAGRAVHASAAAMSEAPKTPGGSGPAGSPPPKPKPSVYERALVKTLELSKGAILAILNALKICVTDPKRAIAYLRELWPKIKEEAHHYWVGTKLLATEVQIASKLVKRVIQGKELTRTERKLLTRTAGDLIRLVPMIVILIVPFLELLLPVILKVFPNMLPSTFEDKLKKEEEVKKQLKVKIEMAKVLQDTVVDMATVMKTQADEEKKKLAIEFSAFLEKVRRGYHVTNQDILKFAKLFKDELTLDNLSRHQLVAMCKYMTLPIFGSDLFLRFQLRQKLARLKKDDREILWEGVDTLTREELRSACRERGIRASNDVPESTLRENLKEWIELSMVKDIPSSLLILSRAFLMTEKERAEEVLQATLSAMPEKVTDELILEMSDARTVESKQQKLEVLQRQKEVLVEQEAAEKAKEKERREKEERERKEREAAEAAAKAAKAAAEAEAAKAAAEAAQAAQAAQAAAQAAATTPPPPEEMKPPPAEEAMRKAHELEELSEAVAVLASESAVQEEKSEIEEMKAREAMIQSVTADPDVEPAVADLNSRVTKLLSKLVVQVETADKSIGASMKLLDLDQDGFISEAEMATAAKLLRDKPSLRVIEEAFARIDKDKDGKISLVELQATVRDIMEGNVPPPAEGEGEAEGQQQEQQEQQQPASGEASKAAPAAPPKQ